MSRHQMAGLLIGMVLAVSRPSVADEPAGRVTVRMVSGGTNVFAGRKTSLDCVVNSQVATDARLAWSVSVERAVIARGEKSLKLNPDRPADAGIEVEFPELRPGVVSPAGLSLDVQTLDGHRAQQTVALYVFSPDVIANRQQWLKSLQIALFDPAKKTRAALEGLNIPLRTLADPDSSRASGLILYGEGLEPARQKPAWQQAIAVAAGGKKVIVLASSGATIPVDGILAIGDHQPTAVSLRRADRIRDYDKRLDAVTWPLPGRLVASSLSLTAKGQTPLAEFRDDAAGWSWLDVRYANGGRLVWTGHGIIESWESTPAARYLFVKMLEELTIESPELGGLKRDVE